MKKDIIKIILKLLIVFAFVFSIIFYCEYHMKIIPNSYSIKRSYFEKELDSIEVLTLGSSQALYDVNPEYFDIKGFNLASVSQSLYYDKEITLKYLDRMPKLKMVFVSISFFSLWYELYSSVENWRDYFYLHYWNVKPNNGSGFNFKQISYIALYGISYSQNEFRKHFSIDTADFISPSGWSIYRPDYIYTLTDSTAKLKVARHLKMMNDDLLQKNINYLDSLVSSLREKNIIVDFISTPVYKSYLDNTDSKKDKIITDVINKLCGRYHCSYFNYSGDSRFEFSDFVDEDHLNPEGAKKLSTIINSEIIKKYLKSN